MSKTLIRTLPVPEDQWDMPVSIDAKGEWVTLQEAIQGHEMKLSLAELHPAQLSELVIARIQSQPDFEVAMLESGDIDGTRAIEEVRAQTDIGQTLIELEQRMIERMFKLAREQQQGR